MMRSSLEPNIKTEPLQPSNQTQNGTIPSLKLGMDPLRSTSLFNQTLSKVLEIGINHPCIIIVLVTNTKEMPK